MTFVQFSESADNCKESQGTARVVDHCPKTEEEWTEASRTKNCSRFKHSCTSFVYHCVINEWETENIEVCAPKKNIVGKLIDIFVKGFQNSFVQLRKK